MMNPPPRKVVLAPAPGRGAEFVAAVEKWTGAEPLLLAVKVFGIPPDAEITGLLDHLWCGDKDAPNYGQLLDDRPRVIALLRETIPAELVRGCLVDGRSWDVE